MALTLEFIVATERRWTEHHVELGTGVGSFALAHLPAGRHHPHPACLQGVTPMGQDWTEAQREAGHGIQSIFMISVCNFFIMISECCTCIRIRVHGSYYY